MGKSDTKLKSTEDSILKKSQLKTLIETHTISSLHTLFRLIEIYKLTFCIILCLLFFSRIPSMSDRKNRVTSGLALQQSQGHFWTNCKDVFLFP